MTVRMIIVFRQVSETDTDDGGDIACNIGERVNAIGNQGMGISDYSDRALHASENDIHAEAKYNGKNPLLFGGRHHLLEFCFINSASLCQSIFVSSTESTAVFLDKPLINSFNLLQSLA